MVWRKGSRCVGKVHKHVQGSISGRDTKGTAILCDCFIDTTTVEMCTEYD